ncbi:MAG: HDOD domain-containing protein [Acidimicrobiales bacterium]
MTAPPAVEDRDAIKIELCKALDSVTVARPTAVRVLTVVDDPNTTAQQVAKAIELDPTFAAQIMRLANSAYYGMSGRIGNTGFAVTVIGFAAVRSMAAISATGLTSNRDAVPQGFWTHAAAAAAGTSVVASRYGLVPADCFAAGLLHDIGSAFLHGFDRAAHLELMAIHGLDGAALAAAETERFGMGHDAAAAHVLATWRFPAPFVDAVANHHVPGSDAPLSAAVRVGDLLALLSTGDDLPAVREELVAEGVAEDEHEGLIEITAERAGEILASLSV